MLLVLVAGGQDQGEEGEAAEEMQAQENNSGGEDDLNRDSRMLLEMVKILKIGSLINGDFSKTWRIEWDT